jgi:hypothetical protein
VYAITVYAAGIALEFVSESENAIQKITAAAMIVIIHVSHAFSDSPNAEKFLLIK